MNALKASLGLTTTATTMTTMTTGVSNKRKSVDDFLRSFHDILNDLSKNFPVETTVKEKNAKNLEPFFENSSFQAVFRLHELVAEYKKKNVNPLDKEATVLTDEICGYCEEIADTSGSCQIVAKELFKLLNKSHFQALLSVHDRVASKDYEPCLPEIPSEVDEDDGLAVRIVRLIKNNEPLGATIKLHEETGSLIIARVMHGGVADRSGCIHVGDRVVEVNGVNVIGKQPTDVVKLLNSSNGVVTFKLIPSDEFTVQSKMGTSVGDGRVRLRALFDYSAANDPMNPCPEAGLNFVRGDILQVVDWNDPHWWQATLETTADNAGTSKVGLVPSKQLQERRIMQKSSPCSEKGSVSGRRSSLSSRRLKKIMYETRAAEDFEQDELKTYEEVARLYPRPDLHRPIVLIGPPGVGRNELKRRLILLNPDRFATTVPHTSRKVKQGETEGVEYHFTTRALMEQWVGEGRYIEYGEYKGNLYGTTIDSVRSVIGQGRVCVLNPHPQAIRMLRTPDIKPYVIFVKPPPLPALKETRQTGRVRSTFDSSYSRGFTDEELEQMLDSAKHLEHVYGHYFDCTLVNGNLEFAFRELLDILSRVETEPQWVNVSWVR